MEHIVEILSVGTELLLGGIANTDAQLLSQGLSELGLNVYYHTVVGDNPGRLAQAVQTARSRADILITTGGLGPTCDDLTRRVLAESFGKKLIFHQDIADGLRAWFARRGQEMTENNLQQALLPEGCTVFENACGTAPGCAFEVQGVHVLMLPGPPGECGDMFRRSARPYLARLSGGVICSHTLKLFGIGESKLESLLREDMETMTNPTLAPYAKQGECELRVTAKAPSARQAEERMAPVLERLRGQLGAYVYGVDVSGLEQVALVLLTRRGLSLGTAVACSGGRSAKRVTDLPGASAAFRGGVVSYCNAVKAAALGVPEGLLEQYGAVSQPVAQAMAQGARRALGCELALSATGVAGPGPDEQGNPAGLVFLGLAAPEGTYVRRVQIANADRARVRTVAAHHALDLARRWLSGLPLEPAGL